MTHRLHLSVPRQYRYRSLDDPQLQSSTEDQPFYLMPENIGKLKQQGQDTFQKPVRMTAEQAWLYKSFSGRSAPVNAAAYSSFGKYLRQSNPVRLPCYRDQATAAKHPRAPLYIDHGFTLGGPGFSGPSSPIDVFVPRIRKYEADAPEESVLKPCYYGSTPPVKHLDLCTSWKGLSAIGAEELSTWEIVFRSCVERKLAPSLQYLEDAGVLRYGGKYQSLELNLVSLVMDMVMHLEAQSQFQYNFVPDLHRRVEQFVTLHGCFTSQRFETVGIQIRKSPSPYATRSIDVKWHPPYLSFENFEMMPSAGQEFRLTPRYQHPSDLGKNKSRLMRNVSYSTSCGWLYFDFMSACFRGIVPEIAEEAELEPDYLLGCVVRKLCIVVKATIIDHIDECVRLEQVIRVRVTVLIRHQEPEILDQTRSHGYGTAQSNMVLDVEERQEVDAPCHDITLDVDKSQEVDFPCHDINLGKEENSEYDVRRQAVKGNPLESRDCGIPKQGPGSNAIIEDILESLSPRRVVHNKVKTVCVTDATRNPATVGQKRRFATHPPLPFRFKRNEIQSADSEALTIDNEAAENIVESATHPTDDCATSSFAASVASTTNDCTAHSVGRSEGKEVDRPSPEIINTQATPEDIPLPSSPLSFYNHYAPLYNPTDDDHPTSVYSLNSECPPGHDAEMGTSLYSIVRDGFRAAYDKKQRTSPRHSKTGSSMEAPRSFSAELAVESPGSITSTDRLSWSELEKEEHEQLAKVTATAMSKAIEALKFDGTEDPRDIREMRKAMMKHELSQHNVAGSRERTYSDSEDMVYLFLGSRTDEEVSDWASES